MTFYFFLWTTPKKEVARKKSLVPGTGIEYHIFNDKYQYTIPALNRYFNLYPESYPEENVDNRNETGGAQKWKFSSLPANTQTCLRTHLQIRDGVVSLSPRKKISSVIGARSVVPSPPLIAHASAYTRTLAYQRSRFARAACCWELTAVVS
jgi:hypothetical protein